MTQKSEQDAAIISAVRARLGDTGVFEPAQLSVALDRAAYFLEILLSPEDRARIHARLEELYSTFIGEGVLLENDADHEPWYAARRGEIVWNFYERYRAYLAQQGWEPRVLARLDDLSGQLLGLLEDPLRDGNWDRRGMVVGQVQSGKTANYTALIDRALDAGYPLVIVLAGRFNDLRSQTQQRIDEGVLGYDTQLVRPGESVAQHRMGVGLLRGFTHRVVNSLTTSAENGDFKRNVGGGIRPGHDPLVMVVKKQKTVLTNLLAWCERVSSVPVLIIDDEADDSSVDTRTILDDNGEPDPEHEPTVINGLIRRLLLAFERRCYVGYTATPYANIFIHRNVATEEFGEDLFPKSFIVSLPAPDNYIGPEKIFGLEDDPVLGPGRASLGLVRPVGDWQAWMPPKHSKDWSPPEEFMPASLHSAIQSFILATAARRARGQETRHSSMLVHATRLKKVQAKVAEQVRDALDALRDALMHAPSSDPVWVSMRALWENDFLPGLTDPLSWEQVADALKAAVSQIEVMIINGDATDSLQYYNNRKLGLKVIAIGGDKLSRGLTLEGLSVSYYLRNAGAYDTLLQMGRWFGYRPGYLDLCRIFTTPDLIEQYTHVTVASEELRQQLELMAERKMNPEEFGLKVRTHPGQAMTVTARNKMRSGTSLLLSYADSLSEQVTFLGDSQTIESNHQAVEKLLGNLGSPEAAGRDGNLIWRGVPPEDVRNLLLSYRVPEASYKMVPSVLDRYIQQRVQEDGLLEWTVVLISNTRTEKRSSVAGHLVGMTRRAQILSDGQRVSIRRLLSPPDESLDLTPEQQQRCTASRMGKQGETTSFSPVAARSMRPPTRGLLLIYALHLVPETANQPAADGTQAPLEEETETFGLAISFPPDEGAVPLAYLVNETFWETEIGGAGA